MPTIVDRHIPTPPLGRIADAVAPRPSRRDNAQAAARHLRKAAAALGSAAVLTARSGVGANGRGDPRRELAHSREELRRATRRPGRRPRRLAVAVGSVTLVAAAAIAALVARRSSPDESAAPGSD
jgi:hypothetical protein